jgi:non-ribosomal peptide synthetase component F
LVLAQRCSSIQHGTPLFSALLNYRHINASSNKIPVDSAIEDLGYKERTNYPFALSVEDYGESLGLTADVVQPYSPSRVCGYMQQALESLASALEYAPHTNASELNVLPKDEQELLLRTWNTTRRDYPDQLCIHHLFEQHVERTPHATALVFDGQSMTYSELNVHANRLAHHLIRLGVRPDSLVAICVERSFVMIVGVLAILKAGGAYVPLDPTFASDRLCDIMSDASPRILIADQHGRQILGKKIVTSVTMVNLEAVEEFIVER